MGNKKKILFNGIFLAAVFGLTMYGVFHGADLGQLAEDIQKANPLYLLAAVACGEYASVEEIADKVVKVTETILPGPELAQRYDERYAQFKEIYPACRPVFALLAK